MTRFKDIVLPCPFCGQSEIVLNEDDFGICTMWCSDCMESTSEDEAVEKWNRRTIIQETMMENPE